jgi:hypothetical protein
MTHGGPIVNFGLGNTCEAWSFVSCASKLTPWIGQKGPYSWSPHVVVVVYCFVIIIMILHELSLDFGMLALFFA